MKRISGHSIALAYTLAALVSAGAARAATDPAPSSTVESPSESPPPAAAEAAPLVAPAPTAAAAIPPPAPAAPPPPPPSIRLKTEQPQERDSYGGPPLLLGNGKKVKVGAFAALGGGYTRFMGKDSGVMSLEAALLVEHRFSIGLAGYGFTRTPRGPNASDGTRQEFGSGYGGLAIRYSWLSNLPIYPTFGVVLGAGAVNLHRAREYDDWGHGFDDDDTWRRGRFDPFLVVQPELALNANATRWLRLGANVGYRFTGGVGRFGLDNRDLNGLVVGGTLAFGWF